MISGFNVALSWIKTMISGFNVALFLFAVTLMSWDHLACKTRALYNEAPASCEIVSQHLQNASHLFMGLVRNLLRPEPLLDHFSTIASLALISLPMLHGYSIIMNRVFFCDCICRRFIGGSKRLGALDDDSSRDDTVDNNNESLLRVNHMLENSEVGQNGADYQERMEQHVTVQESRIRRNDTVEEQHTPQRNMVEVQNIVAHLHGAPSSSEFNCPAPRPDPNVAERVVQSAPMEEHAAEHGQELMGVEELARTQNAANDDLTGPDAHGDENALGQPMEIDDPSEPTNQDGIMSSAYRNSITSDPGDGGLNQNLKKRSSPGLPREGSEKKQKMKQLSAFQHIVDEQAMVRLTEQAEQEKAQKEKEAETKRKEETVVELNGVGGENTNEVAQTQVADDVDSPSPQNQRAGGSNARPVSLLSDDEEDEGNEDDDAGDGYPSQASAFSSSDDDEECVTSAKDVHPRTVRKSDAHKHIVKSLNYGSGVPKIPKEGASSETDLYA